MRRFLTASAALLAVAALTAAPSFAATAAHPAKTAVVAATAPVSAKPTVVTFKTIDANHDGKISFAELLKFYPHTTKAEFAKFAKAGFLNHAELAAFAKAQQLASVKPTK